MRLFWLFSGRSSVSEGFGSVQRETESGEVMRLGLKCRNL